MKNIVYKHLQFIIVDKNVDNLSFDSDLKLKANYQALKVKNV